MYNQDIKLFFWQNVLSIHQCALLSSLGRLCSTELVAAEKISENRIKQGWTVPEMPGVKLCVSPDKSMIADIMKNNNDSNCIHIVSGFSSVGFKKINLIKELNEHKIKPYIFTEPYNNRDGIKSLIRWGLYRFYALRYRNKISGIFATGRIGTKCYEACGFKHIFEWGYFTVQKKEDDSIIDTNDKHGFRVLFVGSLCKRKNVLSLITEMIKVLSKIEVFTIIGDGPLKNEVLKRINGFGNIQYMPNLDNSEVQKLMKNYDLLVLPSLFDGWGAVINEALYAGCRVLASDNCGAASLLDSPERGSVFHLSKDSKDMFKSIQLEIEKGIQTAEKRAEVSKWSETHISGEAAAKKMFRILSDRDSAVKDVALWHQAD
jgi:glycosyltransferase involved in cell wall biosynthesis